MSDSLQPCGLHHTRLPYPSPTPEACSNSSPLSWWCHLKHLILCHPLLLLPSIFPSIRVFPNESVLCIRWPKYWSFSFCISPSNEYSGLISFRIDWFDLLAVQGTLKSLLQHHSSKVSILQHSAFFMVQHTSIHDYWKNQCLAGPRDIGKVMSLLFDMLSRFVIASLPRSKGLFISWLKSTSTVILETKKIKVCHPLHCFPVCLPWSDSSWAISNPKRWSCESAALNMPTNLENSAPWPQDWKRSVFIPIPKKGNAKECTDNRIMLKLCSSLTLVMFKILQARLQKYENRELPDVQDGFRKGREPEIKLPTFAGSSKKQEHSRKTSISALLTMPKSLTVWITIYWGKFWKRWEYQTTWPASWEICVQVRKQQLELDMEQ